MNACVPAKARVLHAATIVAGAAALGAATLQTPLEAAGTLLLLCGGVVLAEMLQITSQADADVEDPTFSFSSAVHLAAVLILGPWAAVVVAVFGVLAVDRLRRSPWDKVAFNAGVFALATLAGGVAFTAAGGAPGTLALPGDFAPIAAAAVAYGVVNAVLVTLIVVLWSRAPLRGALSGSLASTAASSAAEAALGVLLALTALEEPWAIVAVVPLVVVAYHAHSRHVQLRRETRRALETFANVIDERDSGTYRHSARVAELVGELARGLHLPLSEVARLEAAGRVHDLGKIAVDAAVLRKPGKLSAEEWAAMRRHARLSARLLRSFHFAAGEARAVEYHHERFDGCGYYGIASDEIPLAAHFLVVADTFDAMCSDRPYRRGLSEDEALAEIERNAGTQFHPAVAKAFVAQRRGLDPISALSSAEYDELRGLEVGVNRRRLPALRLELVAVVALAVGLGSAGLSLPAGVVAAALAAAGALVVHRTQLRRARRLASGLRAGLSQAPTAPGAFRVLLELLSAACTVRWAGVLDWHERDLSGAIVLATGPSTAAPGNTALTSWLVREADVPGELLRERHGSRILVAVPLEVDGATTGYLVLLLDRVPRHLEVALRDLRAELATTLTPLCGRAPTPALVAVS